MKKRIISAVLAVCLALTLLPVNAWAAAGDGSEAGSLTWTYDEATKTATVSGTGTITRQDVEAFQSQYSPSMSTLIIHDGITAIGDRAFASLNYGLTGVTIPGSVKSIGVEAFATCYSLASVTFSGDVESIKIKAFYDCTTLASVTFSGSVASIGDQAFANCYSLSGVTFPGDVGLIGNEAFYDCDRLASVTFSGNVGPIGHQAFASCEKLAGVTFSGKVDSIGKSAFYDCESLVKFSVPDGTASLGEGAFARCGKLTTVYIPSSATVGANLFSYCDKLMDVYYGGTQEQWKQEVEPYVPTRGDLPFIHCGAAGLPPTTAHSVEELFELLEAGKDAALTYIDLDGDIQLDSTTGGLVIPEKRAVQLDLKGRRITSGTVFPMATVRGALTVLDSTVTGEPVVNDDDSVTYTAGGFFATSVGDKAAIAVEDGGTFTLEGGKIEAAGIAISADNNQAESGVWDASRVQIDSGYVRSGSGPAVSVYRRGGVWVWGGVLVSERNTVIDFSDAPEARSNAFSSLSMYGGTLISKGAPTGSLPCGIYFPQQGNVTFISGEIRARGGIGILMRKGWLRIDRAASYTNLDIIVTKAGTGKIGRSPLELELESGHCVVLDEKSGYADQEGDGRLQFQLRQNLPEKFRPHVYVSDGNELKVSSTSGSSLSPEWYFSFGPSTAHTVTFNANGSGADDIVLKTNSDQRIEEWPALTRAGYDFRGWTTGPEGLYAVADNYRFKGDTTLYAIWIPEGSHFVDFIVYKDSGIFARRVTGPDGRVADWPRNPTPVDHPFVDETYTFVGWHSVSDGDIPTRIDPDHVFTEDTVLYSYWERDPGPYTITFDLNGGAGTGGEKTTDAKGVLAKDQWPENPTREGYLFEGWTRFRDSSFTVRPEDNFYSDTTLYARWVPVDGYAITFNLNEDGSAGTIYRTEHTAADGTLTSWPDEPQRAGYRFRGWYFDRDGGYRLDLEKTYSFSDDTTLYAHWTQNSAEEKTYTITFDPNDGTGGGTLTTGTDGRLSALPANPTRAGYTFGGWYTAKSGGSRVTTSTQFKEDTTVYARWTQNSTAPADKYTITFDPNGGTGGSILTTGTDGKLSALPANPTRTDYTFDGWYTAKSGGSKVTKSTQFKGDTTVYARWSQPSVTYRIYAPGATYGGSFSVSHSSAVPGTLVIVTSSPWSNFALNQLSAIRADTGRELYLTGPYSNQYTFLMPDSDVRLSGSFTQTYTGTTSPSSPGTNTCGGNSGSTNASAGTRPVNWYYSGGSIYHVTDGLVPAGNALTRDMLVSVLYNMDSTSSGQPTIWAAENNIVPDIYQSGLWGTDKPISREQAAMILFCYARHKGYATYQTSSLTGYADYSQIRSMARPAMAWSRAIGLITATSARTLSPQAILTCAEANAILARFVSGVASAW